jgi:hypothetical protein
VVVVPPTPPLPAAGVLVLSQQSQRFFSSGSSSKNNNNTSSSTANISSWPSTATTTTKKTITTSSSSNPDSNSNNWDDASSLHWTSVYVHPLSQIVLQQLQDQWHHWIVTHQGQDLKIHRDGTFEIELSLEKNGTKHRTTTTAATGTTRIWTFYDPLDKKHWLSIRKDNIQHRFLLQDNLVPAWNGHKRQSLPERIYTLVQEMIHAMEELEQE